MSTSNAKRRARTMTASRPLAASLLAGLPATGPALSFLSLSDRPDGARIVLSPCSPLVVGIAPLSELDRLRAVPALSQIVDYALIHRGEALDERPEIRWGETVLMPARIARHRTHPPLPIEEVLLIGSTNPRHFGESALLALQEALTHQAHRAGRARVVGGEAQTSWLASVEPALIARWLTDLRVMLVALGCPYLEPRGAVLRPRVEHLPRDFAQAAINRPTPVAVPVGYTLDLPAGLVARPDATRFSLTWRGLRAHAVVAGSWTVLRAGSELHERDRGGIQDCLSRKRQRLLTVGLLRPVGQGRLRLLRDLGLPSLVNAARVITGGNESDRIWIRH